MGKWNIRILLLLLLAGAGYGGYRLYQQLPARQETVPTAKVSRGEVVVRSHARGELRAVRSATLAAPNLAGNVQITRLAAPGAFARSNDLIVEFDDSELQTRLEEKQLEVEQIDEQVKKAQADLRIRENQDQVEVLRTNFAVRRSELEMRRNELLPAIDQRRNTLNMEEAKRRLQQLESDIKSRREQAKAELAVLEERRRKSRLEMDRERDRLKQVRLIAPITGLVAIRQNRNTNFFFGQALPDLRDGDQVQPGTQIADVLDLTEMEVSAKVNEIDRASLREGQEVKIRLDAIPDRTFQGRIKTMSATASANVFSADPVKRFDVTFSVDMKDLLAALGAKPEQLQKLLAAAERNRTAPPAGQGKAPDAAVLASAKLPPPPEEDSTLDVLLRPGLLVDVEIILDKVADAIHVPANAVFEKDGKDVVYVREGSAFVPRPVRISKRSESTMIIAAGLKPGETVALADPNDKGKRDKKKGGGAMSGMPAGGGR